MHKLVGITMAAFIVPFSVEAVKFESVLVRQQWPWNAKVNIDYVLTEADGKMWDVSVAFRAGGETLDVPSASLSGDRYSVSAGQRRIANADFFRIGIPFTLAAIIPAYILIWVLFGV